MSEVWISFAVNIFYLKLDRYSLVDAVTSWFMDQLSFLLRIFVFLNYTLAVFSG